MEATEGVTETSITTTEMVAKTVKVADIIHSAGTSRTIKEVVEEDEVVVAAVTEMGTTPESATSVTDMVDMEEASREMEMMMVATTTTGTTAMDTTKTTTTITTVNQQRPMTTKTLTQSRWES